MTASNQDYLRRHVLPKTDGYALGQSQVAQGRQQPAAANSAGVVVSRAGVLRTAPNPSSFPTRIQ